MTAIGEKHYFVISVVLSVLVMHTALAQRPPFAGSRPPNGLNQKDKYNSNTVVDVQNRFGESDAPISNQIPYGQPQKPPVGLVVSPITTYTPLESSRPVLASNNGGVLFEDRFGDSGPNVVSSSPATTSRPAQPLAAHNDPQLIDQLSRLPQNQQPFWFVNYLAIEAQRNGSVANLAGAQESRGSFSG